MSTLPTPALSKPSRHLIFEATTDIFASDAKGQYEFPLIYGGEALIETQGFDEIRLLVSAWYPSPQRTLDLDRTYLEVRVSVDPDDPDHWIKLAEIEPVVPAYGCDHFDGWIVLPVLSSHSRFLLFGSGYDPRARVQIRSSAYLVA